jgi:hypothetical protein
LEGIAKYKNLRGLTIYSQNLQQLPNTIFDLDLFEFTLVLTSTETSTIVDLSKISNFKNLRTLTINIAGKVLLVEDFAVLEHLKELTLVGFTNAINIKSLPKAELTKLDFSNLNGLSGIDGNFSDFKKLGRLSFESIQNFTMPAKFSGNIWDLKLNANAFSTFPDLTQLVLSRIEFITFTGTTLPENFQSYLKPGAQVFFPRVMVNSKDYAKLKKAGFTLFPKSN